MENVNINSLEQILDRDFIPDHIQSGNENNFTSGMGHPLISLVFFVEYNMMQNLNRN